MPCGRLFDVDGVIADTEGPVASATIEEVDLAGHRRLLS